MLILKPSSPSRSLLPWPRRPSAQSLTGALSGTVREQTGPALPAVVVTLVAAPATARDQRVRRPYRFPAVPPGSYELKV